VPSDAPKLSTVDVAVASNQAQATCDLQSIFQFREDLGLHIRQQNPSYLSDPGRNDQDE